MSDILFMLVCGMISGCTDLEMIIEFSEERINFLKRHTELTNIPYFSILSNILKIVNPDHLELCLYGILSNVFEIKMKVEEREISIDGKTICSTATMKEHERPMHIITALLADKSLSLGQKVIESKSNEIPAVRELLDEINIKETIITMEAMHCQKETAEKIVICWGDMMEKLKKRFKIFNKEYYYLISNNNIVGKAWITTKFIYYRSGLHIEIFKNMRNKGYGTKFYNLLLNKLSEKDVEAIVMWVNKKNKIAINFMNKNVKKYEERLYFLNYEGFVYTLIVD